MSDGPQCAVLGLGVFCARFPNASALVASASGSVPPPAGGGAPSARPAAARPTNGASTNGASTNGVSARSSVVPAAGNGSGSKSTHAGPAAASGALLDKHSRRRASDLTKACADVYGEALQQAGLDPLQVAAVFGSALGEASTTIGLLDQLWRGPGMLSPMRFASSVHNTAAGVVSIGTKNTGFTTALGADHDTPAMALLEAFAFALVHQTAVIVVCADEGAPADLVEGEAGWEFLAGAVAIAPAALAPAAATRITAPRRQEGGWVSDLPRGLAQNPCVGVLDLIAGVARKEVTSVRLDRGRGHGYCVSIVR